MKSVVAAVLVLGFGIASACIAPPKGYYEDYVSLVENTPTIVLARASSVEDGDPEELRTVSFIPTRTLKGRLEDSKKVILTGYVVDDALRKPNDFDSHKDPRFWALSIGNSGTPGDCQAYGVFHLGSEYLLFVRQQGHLKGFELIRSPDDLWLQVIELVAEGKFVQGR